VDAAPEPTGIFLRGIPQSTQVEDLSRLFEVYGSIAKIQIVPSKTHDTNTAYVDFETEVAAAKVRVRVACMCVGRGARAPCVAQAGCVVHSMHHSVCACVSKPAHLLLCAVCVCVPHRR
jgi:hypothetical protein